MHHYESMQYLNTVYPERHDVVKDVDDRMKCENVVKYMTFSHNSKRKKKVCYTIHHITVTW